MVSSPERQFTDSERPLDEFALTWPLISAALIIATHCHRRSVDVGRLSDRGALIDSFSIVFDSDRLPGKMTGKLTWRGFNCGAKDEPIAATWDGATLKFEATTRPNVNAQRMNGQCSTDPSRFALNKKADGRSFEGEVRSGDVVVTLTASP